MFLRKDMKVFVLIRMRIMYIGVGTHIYILYVFKLELKQNIHTILNKGWFTISISTQNSS